MEAATGQDEANERQSGEHAEEMQALMRDFWKSFGVEVAGEAFCSSSSAGNAAGDGFEEIRLPCDVLWLWT